MVFPQNNIRISIVWSSYEITNCEIIENEFLNSLSGKYISSKLMLICSSNRFQQQNDISVYFLNASWFLLKSLKWQLGSQGVVECNQRKVCTASSPSRIETCMGSYNALAFVFAKHWSPFHLLDRFCFWFSEFYRDESDKKTFSQAGFLYCEYITCHRQHRCIA